MPTESVFDDPTIDSSAAAGTSWHAVAPAVVAARLAVEPRAGLNQTEADARLQQYGPNKITETATVGWFEVLRRQFVDPLIWILLAAALISLLIGEWTDALTILAIVILNGVLGFIQEWKAEQSVRALQSLLSPKCRVIRDGTEHIVAAEQLVPGDSVVLDSGDRVPADLRLIEAVQLRVDESTLTGESDSVSKQTEPIATDSALAEHSCMAWMGTTTTNGRGLGVVVATAERTQFGHIATLTQNVETGETPLQARLKRLGRQLGFYAIGVSALVALVGWLVGRTLVNTLMTGISLAVAVVPEGLPAVVTITLALGIRAMVKRRALLRKLQAAESLGAATVICTDKTGTLTQNQMTVQRIWLASGSIEVTGTGYDPAGHFEINGQRCDYHNHADLLALLRTGLNCNHATIRREGGQWQEIGEPTEAALVVAAYKGWLSPDEHGPFVNELAFSSDRKRMTVIEDTGAKTCVAHTKGAPEVILERCEFILDSGNERPLTDSDRNQIKAAQQEMAESGLRTLAIARRTLPRTGEPRKPVDPTDDSVEQQLTLLGVVGIIDPPRPEVPEAIRIAEEAGIKVIMITGDALPTAKAIGTRVGLTVDRVIDGAELDRLDDSDLSTALEEQVLFGRTTPEHKLRIVRLLQQQGHVVGMTGDGVNDAPALKQAEIGIAMGARGTDVARSAADMVLMDDNFSSIIGAIEEGRRQYDNIQKFVRYLLSSNTGELVAIVLNIVVGGPLILLPVQILWMNLVTDGLTAIALGLEPVEANVMKRPPRDPQSSILNRSGILMIAALGLYVGLVALWLFHHYLNRYGEAGVLLAQTVAFTGIIIAEKVNVLNFRSLTSPLSLKNHFSNKWILLTLVLTIGLQVCAVYVPVLQTALHTVPLSAADWGLIVVVSIPVFVVTEVFKWFLNRSRRQSLV